ncbi:ImmA/IrrE family metallo-endopeptidase [Burkholderia pseudomallei]|uniref:ImmA/IrrE family metallo-endopeptidase n=1 Tax=Burkholderia pseudomallei TaxID=28450 RepID=UPI000F4DB61C|nr:ImmA/IrrE family metallo-endopeptidase [Burkholderia pseudomallei]RPE15473.1 ImmA/IrrE family metallo-endopeptidase [Burkholderia pseudomallei]RPE20094.1 ImmA/IrrE family metallo-endopeptidase [Burkholderia pseudomallei]RQS89280.1 ImmA/IrrE family metallo-endopeptidase [Burkholderia pseudomallei]RQZ48850.1 ImmA/IrrE family metallo-endopeptidase [Burkholderia pseudomallei]RSK62240.1 ImmA/IrrE family metallo-endopeptidase [Burkholderia pseudomallei]
MTAVKKPKAAANQISSMLNAVLGVDRFPVKVDELALEYSRQCFADSPIDKVVGEDMDDFEGMLAANKARSKWLIVYNSAVRSEGRKRFTVAHEFAHYLLHRHQQDRFECGTDDIETGDNNGRDIEAEADVFASTLLMPLDDFRRQVGGQPVSFDLLGHCADRYGVSLTAAALRWTEIAPKRVVVVASRDDHMLWAKSNDAAFKSGAYFATRSNTIELPRQALAHSDNGWSAGDQQTGRAQHWFPHEPASMPVTEMTRVAGQYDYTLTLLSLPDAEWQRPRLDDEEAEEDTFDRFVRNGQYPVR